MKKERFIDNRMLSIYTVLVCLVIIDTLQTWYLGKGGELNLIIVYLLDSIVGFLAFKIGPVIWFGFVLIYYNRKLNTDYEKSRRIINIILLILVGIYSFVVINNLLAIVR